MISAGSHCIEILLSYIGYLMRALPALSRLQYTRGYPMKKVAEPIIARGELTEIHLEQCRELGQTLAAGLVPGIF